MARATHVAAAALAHALMVSASSVPSLIGGTVSDFGRANELSWFSISGFDTVRRMVLWEDVEARKGQYNWTATDAVVNALQTTWTSSAWLTFSGPNGLYDGGMAPKSSLATAAFVKFVTTGAARYSSNVSVLECWDSPNDAASWPPAPDAAAYAALCQRVTASVRAVQTGARIVALSAAPMADGSGLDVGYVAAAFRGGLLEGLDGVHVHLGRWDHSTGSPSPPEAAAGDVATLQALLREHSPPGGAVPLYAASFAYGSVPEAGASALHARPGRRLTAGGPSNVDPATQAKFVTRALLHGLATGVNVTVWHAWRDGEGCNSTYRPTTRSDPPPAPACTLGVVGGTYHNETYPYDQKPSFWGASSPRRGIGSQCAFVGTLLLNASGSVPGSGTNSSHPCFAQYWACGFLTPGFNAWCASPPGWSTSLTFPFDPPTSMSSTRRVAPLQGSVGRGHQRGVGEGDALFEPYQRMGHTIVQQQGSSGEERSNGTGVCYWPLNYMGFQQGGLVCSGGSPLSWTLPVGDAVWYLVPNVNPLSI